MSEDVLLPRAGRPDSANLLGWEDKVLQKQRWKRSSYGGERKAGSKV